MDGLQISVQNFSSLRWHRNIWAVGAGRTEEVNWTDEITQTPLEALDKHNGSATGAASTVHLSGLVEDALWMRLGYASDEGNLAVEVRQFFHLFGIGGQDKWLYWDQGWSEPTSDTAVHKWTFKTVQAVATPALSDATGAVTVVISDIPQGTLMPNLMIGMIGGVWTVQIENVPGIMYTFVGGDPATQAMWVQEFAEQMFAEAPDLAVAALTEVDLGNAVEVARAVQQLFHSTSGMLFEGESIITAGGGETLFDILEAAGDALMEALAANGRAVCP